MIARQSFEKPDVEFVDRASEEINARGICLLRNELGILPLKNAKEQKILIVDVTDEDRRGATELFEREFVRRGLHPTVVRDIYDEVSTVCWQDDIDALQNQYDIVIFHVDMAYSTSWRPPYMLVWASHLFERQKKVIVNYGSPFFAETYFQTDSTCVEVNSGATEQTVRALVARLLGEEAFEGKRILHSKPLAHF